MKIAYSTALVVFIFLCFSAPAKSQSNPHKYIMDSLSPYASREVKKRRYQALKDLGAEAVTMDMWWGIIEPEEGKFDWSIYKENFEIAREVGLQIIPIFSFHSVNEGNAKFPLGKWIWNKFKDMKFKDSDGIENEEFIEYLVAEAHELRKNVLISFKENFHQFDSVIPKIYVGLGPSGEARYPSFSAYWNYPGVGRHQAGSDRAKLSFQNFAREKYGIIEKLNGAWGTHLDSFENVDTPTDGLRFFEEGVKTEYGRDFMEWYQGVLEKSIDQDQRNANEVLKGENGFHGVLAGKIAGLYWLATDWKYPHGAERAAGYNDYDRIMKIFARNNFELTFTCFEMENKDQYPDFSRAADLVSEIAQLGKKNNVKISGENAEPFDLGYKSWDRIDRAYRNINRVFELNAISAFTFLRADFLINEDGSLRPEAVLYKKHLAPAPQEVAIEEEEHVGLNPLLGCGKKLGKIGHQSPLLQH
jgi:hypothetical protein